jgi:hypothetical protein
VLRVDQVFGNDTTAALAPSTKPFLTVGAAITAATSGQEVWVFPGFYHETITIPTGVSVRGKDALNTSIGITGATTNTTVVSMAPSTRLEDINVVITSSSTQSLNLIGIDIQAGAANTAKIRTSNINLTHTGGATGGSIIGLNAGATGSLVYTNTTITRGCDINVLANSLVLVGNTGPTVRGVLSSASNRMALRDTSIQVGATGGNAIGVEGTNAASQIELRECSIQASNFDISRTAGAITLTATDLIDGTAHLQGFAVTTEPSHVYLVLGSQVNYGGAGSAIATPTGTYYLTPGTQPANFAGAVIGIPFAQRTILIEGLLSSTLPLPGACVATVNYYITTTPNTIAGATLITSGVINSGTPTALSNNFSRTFQATTDYLLVQVVITGASTTANTNIVVGVSLY